MKRIVLLFIVLCNAICIAHAQTTDTAKSESAHPSLMSLGLDLGSAAGITRNTFNSTMGVSFKFEFPFPTKGLYLTLSAAYENFSTKNTPALDTMQNGHYIPLLAGLKYFVYKPIYIEGDIGESFNINSPFFGYQTAFIYSPVVGVSLPIQKNNAAIDIGVKYESRRSDAGNINQYAIRIAYKFKL
jgi:hypothetical protein